MDYVLADNNVITLVENNSENTGIKEWIKSKDKNIVLEQGDVKEVSFDINAPSNASIGSHRGIVLFRVKSSNSNDDTVKVQGQIGVHVLINVKGDTHAGGYISKFDIPLLVAGSVEYATEFKNTGNADLIILRNNYMFLRKQEKFVLLLILAVELCGKLLFSLFL